ncbi:MAG: N-acetylmuramoyl-L-alanine amidase [Candidatus Dojkabacteria bacterium]|nr:N-acetylmuramoyl-L-alanine amidase [Candidatus Dojkabacteria bacterium]
MGRVLLGAAHTLMQPGEIYKDLREADLTRKFLKFAISHLEKKGIEFKTVPLDLSLLKRIDWINNTGYSQETDDVFIELHVNDGGKRGIENWYSDDPGEDNPSQRFAEFMIDDMCSSLGFTNHGAKSEHDCPLTSLLILNQTKTISIATELLFIDNEEDIAILKDDSKVDNLMKVLVESIAKFFEDIKKIPLKKKQK